MNPETRYTNRIRKILKAELPGVKMWKHSDRFHGGVADLEVVFRGVTVWIEVKYLPKIAKRRWAGVTDLQLDCLLEHFEAGVPAYVLVGTDDNKGHMCYRVDKFDGNAYRKDIENDSGILNLIWQAERMTHIQIGARL